MNPAQDLVVKSYRYSCHRIRVALNGAPITNSTGRVAPPLNAVAGICGQGGGHLYFEVSIRDLQIALDEIEGASGLDDVAAACAKLRRRTTFNRLRSQT